MGFVFDDLDGRPKMSTRQPVTEPPCFVGVGVRVWVWVRVRGRARARVRVRVS